MFLLGYLVGSALTALPARVRDRLILWLYRRGYL